MFLNFSIAMNDYLPIFQKYNEKEVEKMKNIQVTT